MAVEVVRFLLEKFSKELKEEAGVDFPFKKKFNDINEKLEKIRTHLNNPKANLPPRTADLLRESIYELDDMLIEWKMLAKKRRESGGKWQQMYPPSKIIQTMIHLYKIGGKIQKAREDLEKKKPEGTHREDETDQLGTDKDVRWTTRAIDENLILEFFKEQADKIIKNFLIPKEQESGNDESLLRIVGLVGMGGIGKTALAQMIFRDERVRSRFLIRLWICVSPTCEKRELVVRILQNLGVEEELIESLSRKSTTDLLPNDGLGELLFTLYLKLLGKRYLIVFDDVWKTGDWYGELRGSQPPKDARWSGRLAHGLPKGDGSAIIFTSRIEEVRKKMESGGHIDRPPKLPEDAVWDLIKACYQKAATEEESTGPSNQLMETLKSQKKELVGICYGLPLAAKTVGEIMWSINKDQEKKGDQNMAGQPQDTASQDQDTASQDQDMRDELTSQGKDKEISEGEGVHQSLPYLE